MKHLHAPIWVLITGLVRDEAMLAKRIETLNEWQAQGRLEGVVFSTWVGEIDLYSGLRRKLLASGVILVESEPPDMVIQGHALHQLKSLREGLRVVPPDALVLKLRVDFAFLNSDVLDGVTHREDLAIDAASPFATVFSSRILIVGGLLTQPMFLNDIQFAGMKSDLERLSEFKHDVHRLNPRLNAEQVIHSSPFLEQCVPLAWYCKASGGLVHGNSKLAADVLRACFEHDFFVDVLSLYYRILESCFCIGMRRRAPPQVPEGALRLSEISYEQFFLSQSAVHTLRYYETANAMMFADDSWIAPVLEGGLKMDSLGERFCHSAKNILNAISWPTRDWRTEAMRFRCDIVSRFPEWSQGMPQVID